MSVPTSELGYQTEGSIWQKLDTERNPELTWPQSINVFDKMRTDPQVISVLRAVQLPILRAEWSIDGTGCKARVTKQIADDFGLDQRGKKKTAPSRTKGRFSFNEHLRHALLELVYGHSYFEQVYRLEGQQAHLRKLAWRPPQTISKFNVDTDGGLISIEQHGIVAGPGKALFARSQLGSTVTIPVDRLVAYVNEREGGNWMGRSLLRSAYMPWLLKGEMLRTQAQAGDRNGLGVPVYTGPELPKDLLGEKWLATRDDDLKRGLAIAQGLRAGENAGAAIPFGAKLELVGVQGKVMDLAAVIQYYDEQIARSVLAHFLNLGTQTGSWALGSTFADFFVLSLQTVAMHIADIINAHIIEDLVDINWGPNEAAPRLVFEEIGSQHPATAEAITALVTCGALTPDEALEAHLRTMFGLPALDPTTARKAKTSDPSQDPGTAADPAAPGEGQPDPVVPDPGQG